MINQIKLLICFGLLLVFSVVKGNQDFMTLVEPLVTPQTKTFNLNTDHDDPQIRQGEIYFDSTLLEELSNSAQTQTNKTEFSQKTFTITPFYDKSLSVVLTESKQSQDGVITYSGHLSGESMQSVTLVITDQTYVLNIDDNHNRRHYQLIADRQSHIGIAKEIDPAHMVMDCGVDEMMSIQPPLKPTPHNRGIKSQNFRPDLSGLQPAQQVEIDIMFVYGQRAMAWLNNSANGYNGDISAFGAATIANLNQAMVNSRLNISFRLVHQMTVSYSTEGDSGTTGLPRSFDTTLHKMREGTEVPWNSVHQARDQYHADMVAFLTAEYTGGLAYISNPAGIPGHTFSVSGLTPVSTLIHELGHNFGAHHASSQLQSPGPNADFGNYAAGWYFNNPTPAHSRDHYRTIMSYIKRSGGFWITAPVFSSPDLLYNGQVPGDINSGDNRRVLTQTASLVANYRQNPLDTISLNESLDNVDLTFTTSGDGAWFGQRATFYVDGTNYDAAQSPYLSSVGQNSSIKTTITTEGELTFYAKKSFPGNNYRLYVNGTLIKSLNSTDFTEHTVSLNSGTNQVEWRYSYDGGMAWLDKVDFVATQVNYSVSVSTPANGSLSCDPMSGASGITVNCTAIPNSGYLVDAWSGACAGATGNACSFSLTADSTVGVSFKQITYSVSVNTPANGSLSCDPMSGVSGITVNCTAIPNSGYLVDAWSGACAGATGNACSFSLTADSTVGVSFKQITYSVSVSTPANGSLSCTPMNGVSGTTVNCTAIPNSGYLVDAWSGACAGSTGNACSFSLTADSHVGVNFMVSDLIFKSGFEALGDGNLNPRNTVVLKL